jgi:hypothetical protein
MKCQIYCIGLENSVNYGDNVMIWSLESFFERIGYQNYTFSFATEPDCINKSNDIINIFINNASSVMYESNIKQSAFVGTLIQARHNGEFFRKYVKNYDLPILCRDRRTVTFLNHYGYNTVLFGCNTLLLPKRTESSRQNIIYGVDMPDSLYKYMPQDIKEQLIDLGSSEHVPTNLKGKSATEIIQYNLEFSKNKLHKIRDTGKMIITSRLHIAAPCLAMGVPVILAKQDLDHRFDVLEPFIPLYSERDFEKIDWNPNTIDLEDTKNNMCYLLKSILDELARRRNINNNLSSYVNKFNINYSAKHTYKPVVQANYAYFVYTNSLFDKYNFFEQIIGNKLKNIDLLYYGCGQIGKHFFNSTYTLLKQAKSFSFIDNNPKYDGITFEGFKIIKSSDISNYNFDNLKIIITANGFMAGTAHDIANSLSRDYGFVDGKDYFLYEFIMILLTEYNFNNPFDLTTRLVSKVSTTHDIFKVLP